MDIPALSYTEILIPVITNYYIPLISAKRKYHRTLASHDIFSQIIYTYCFKSSIAFSSNLDLSIFACFRYALHTRISTSPAAITAVRK